MACACGGGSPLTAADLKLRLPLSKPLRDFHPGVVIVAYDKMGRLVGLPQKYTYTLESPPGENFQRDFRPAYTPQEMLKLGVFSGKYLNDCMGEFPREWFETALAHDKLRPGPPDHKVNLFGVKSRSSLGVWKKKGWIVVAPGARDARGWFQWYCRYWLGRRQAEVDAAQIARWKSFNRHAGQIVASYQKMSPSKRPKTKKEKLSHRPRQRQALLQWAYNPWV